MPNSKLFESTPPNSHEVDLDKTVLSPAEIAQAMIDNGFRVVPLKLGEKKPYTSGWVGMVFRPEDFNQNNGIGLKTGEGIIAVDIDYYGAEVVEAIVAEFERRFGPTLRRTGQAPKTALLAYCDVSDKKKVKLKPSGFAPMNEKGQPKPEQVEILALGQQLVAYGLHPDTRNPYEWHGKGPWDKVETGPPSVAHVPFEGLNQFLEWTECEHGLAKAGPQILQTQSLGSAPRSARMAGISQPVIIPERSRSPAEVKEILSHIPTPDDYDDWLQIYFGIKSLGDEYYSLADEWSVKGGGYDPVNNRRIWDSAKKDGGITFKSVAAAARYNGADLSAIAKRHIGGIPSTISAAQIINPQATKITACVDRSIQQAFQACNAPVPTNLPPANPQVVQEIHENVFLNAPRSKFMFLNDDEHLNEHPEKDASKFIAKRFGEVFDFPAAKNALAQAGAPTKDINSLDRVRLKMWQDILDEIKYKNQRARVEWFVDPFSSNCRVEVRDDVVRVVVIHRPYDSGPYDIAAVNDFRAHFPEFDGFLAWIAASRFALDRKLSYLWMLLPSDFGKGFMMGLLKQLGAVVEMSVKEIEAAFEGKPLARAPEDFRRAIILWVDEFKTVKSELKQLQSEMSIAPKYQLSATVQLYAE